MKGINFGEAIDLIILEDGRYDREAYIFLREALDYSVNAFRKSGSGTDTNVSGGELLEGIREYALQEFGPLTKHVLNTWGIRETADFGEIVFQLVDKGVLGKNDTDSKRDFEKKYDFDEVFSAPFLPGANEKEHDSIEGA